MREEPKGREYWYIDEKKEQWRIKDDAPDWAKKEFEAYMTDNEPDDNGVVTMH